MSTERRWPHRESAHVAEHCGPHAYKTRKTAGDSPDQEGQSSEPASDNTNDDTKYYDIDEEVPGVENLGRSEALLTYLYSSTKKAVAPSAI